VPMDADGPWEILHAEHESRHGSLTRTVRRDFRWDKAAFSRLETAMRAACEAIQEDSAVERWLAEGFWMWTAVIPEMTQHPRFQPPETHYFRQCLARLRDLGSWFFNGTSPYGPNHVWEPL